MKQITVMRKQTNKTNEKTNGDNFYVSENLTENHILN